MKVKLLISFPETGGVTKNRDHSARLKFDVDASQYSQLVLLQSFPDLAMIEATFVLKEVGGVPVPDREKKS